MNLTHKVTRFSSIYNVVYSRSKKLFEAAVRSRNPILLILSFLWQLQNVTSKYCGSYSEVDRALSCLIREIRLCGNLIDGFSKEELDSIVYFASICRNLPKISPPPPPPNKISNPFSDDKNDSEE